MGAQQQVYRRRIRSTQSFQKIFRAQELIATSRIARLQGQVEQSRPYTRQITSAIENIVSQTDISHPLLEEHPDTRVAAVLVITSDRGMAGAYSANVLRTAEELLAKLREEGKEPRLYVVGRKGVAYYRFRERAMAATWTGISERPRFEDVLPVGRTLVDAFAGNEVGEIHAVYTDFASVLSQRPAAYRILPIVLKEVESSEAVPQYLFEPDAETVLDDLLPRYVVSRVYTAALEAAASESASRRRAMKSASDNADELITALTREANQARQAEITQEIMEVVGGAEALRQTGSD